jgi:DNA-binding protein Fis
LLGLPAIGPEIDRARTIIEEATAISYHHSMESHSRWLIQDAMRKAEGNQTKAAALLKLQRTYFTKLLKQKGIAAKSSD